MRLSDLIGHHRRSAAACATLLFASLPAGAISEHDLDRFRVIAGGWQLERHCNHLAVQQRSDLREIAANAEVLTAREVGSDEVRRIVADAREFGEERGADCGAETMEAVELSLIVAYAYAEDYAEPVETPPLSERSEERETAVVEEPEAESNTDVLARFGTQTEAYYLQRRCGHLSYNEDVNFWELIVVRHADYVKRFGAGAVSRMQRDAEARANSAQLSCGAHTRAMVSSGYASLRQDISAN